MARRNRAQRIEIGNVASPSYGPWVDESVYEIPANDSKKLMLRDKRSTFAIISGGLIVPVLTGLTVSATVMFALELLGRIFKR